MAKEHKKTTTVLRIMLGKPIGMKEKTLHKILDRVGHGCDVARNCMVRDWEIRRRNDGWVPEQAIDKSKKPKFTKHGDPWPKKVLGPEKDPGPSTLMYRVARDVVPYVNSNLVAQCSQAVASDLCDRMPWDSDARSVYVFQAILAYEQQPPTYRRRQIPVPNNNVKITWDSQCVIDVPMLSKKDDSGLPRRAKIALRVSRMGNGKKQMIRDVIDGKLKLSDSTLNFKKNRWYLHAVIKHEPSETTNLDEKVSVTLTPNRGDMSHPFAAKFEDYTWQCGFGLQLQAEYRRLEARRRGIRHQSRYGTGRGRGKARFYGILRPMSKRHVNVQDAFCCTLVDDLVKRMIEQRAGTLVYRKPSRYVRDHVWFADRDVPFDWTVLESRLSHRCLREGIKLVVEDLKNEEWKKGA